MSSDLVNERWRGLLEGSDPMLRFGRSVFRLLPSPPRCKLCYAPFSGPGAPLMRLLGKQPWSRNPQICRFCVNWLERRGPGGVEGKFWSATVPPTRRD